jgi:crotonobetainyl-CoA:carnitine CoA-transferase CaiB-like acyl-CoA transferase
VCSIKLAANCDIIVENVRPDTPEQWGFGYEGFRKLDRGAILVRRDRFWRCSAARNPRAISGDLTE